MIVPNLQFQIFLFTFTGINTVTKPKAMDSGSMKPLDELVTCFFLSQNTIFSLSNKYTNFWQKTYRIITHH